MSPEEVFEGSFMIIIFKTFYGEYADLLTHIVYVVVAEFEAVGQFFGNALNNL